MSLLQHLVLIQTFENKKKCIPLIDSKIGLISHKIAQIDAIEEIIQFLFQLIFPAGGASILLVFMITVTKDDYFKLHFCWCAYAI